MKESSDMVREQQAAFAAQNNITLVSGDDDEITQKMAIASTVYKH